MAKLKTPGKPGFPNPDPERYVLVQSKEGWYYRLKRGLGKPAVLNAAYRQSAESTKICSPAARRLVLCLNETLRGLDTGRLTARLAGALKKAYHREGQLYFSFLAGYDFQAAHPLEDLLKSSYTCRETDGFVEVELPIEPQNVKRHSQLVSGYYFDLVLLWGDAGIDGGLHRAVATSKLYAFDAEERTICLLQVPLPERGGPWMALLKVSCLEGHELAYHPRHYGMKVVRVGKT